MNAGTQERFPELAEDPGLIYDLRIYDSRLNFLIVDLRV